MNRNISMDMKFFLKLNDKGILVPTHEERENALECFIEISRDGNAWINGVPVGWENKDEDNPI